MNIDVPLKSIHPLVEDEVNIKRLKYYGEAIDSLVNIGTYLLQYEVNASHNHPEETGAVVGLFRRILEILDASSILIEQGCIIPCMGQVRVLLELALQLEFLLKDPKDVYRKALYFLIAELHSRIVAAKKLLLVPGIDKLRPVSDINAEIAEYNRRINLPVFSQIKSDYLDQVTKKDGSGQMKLGDQKWFSLSDNIQTVSNLIKNLKNLWYPLVYSDLSRYIHSSMLMESTLMHVEGNLFINKIRDITDAKICTTSIIRITLDAYRVFLVRRKQAEKLEFIYALEAYKERYKSIYPRLL